MSPTHHHRLPTDEYSSDDDEGGGRGGGNDGGAAAARALGLPGPERRARPNILITGTPGTGKSTLAEAIVALCGGVPMPPGTGGGSSGSGGGGGGGGAAAPLPLLAPLPPICVGDRVKAQGLHCGYDERMSAFLLDEDKVVDALEREVAGPGDDDDDDDASDDGGAAAAATTPNTAPDGSFLGGRVVEHHGSDFFPARWFDLVLVTRCADTATLWSRLERRNGGAGGGGGSGGGGGGGGAGGAAAAAAAAAASGGGYTEEKIRENVQAEMMGVCSEEAHDAWGGVPHCRVAEVASDSPEDVERAAECVARWCAHWRRPSAAEGAGGAGPPPPFPPPAPGAGE
jgi:adenylate kinase